MATIPGLIRPYETCPMCDGHVMHTNAYTGEVEDGCYFCNDTGTVRARDPIGRFVGNSAALARLTEAKD